MTPSEIANKALDSTLEVVQLLMKCCMKLKESDPATLIISDEIARWVAKDLKLYGGTPTSFSPQLLSFAAIVRQHSKAGKFVSLPDWNSMMENDQRIKTHPLFHKTVGYRPSLTHPDAEPEPSMSSSTVLLEPHSTSGTVVETCMPQHLVASKAPHLIQSLHVVPEVQLRTSEWISPVAPVVEPMMSGVRSTITPMVIPEPSPPVSMPPGTVGQNMGNIGTVRPDMPPSNFVDERGFWHAETRPAGWGLDATVATAVEHSVHYHPRKCDKCIKMNVPCIVLPDKKFGCTRLACANCDEMKITCAIDGAGVWQRLQAKAQGAAMKTGINAPLKHSRMHAPKSRAAVTTPFVSAPAKTTKLSRRSSSLVLQKVVPDNPLIEVEQGPMNLMPEKAPPNMQLFRSLQLPPVDMLAPVLPSVPATPSEPEPTARAILQSIHDLGRRFDLLATNERMDALDMRVDSVERRISLRLTVLEEWFTVSNVHQELLSQSIGNLSMSLRVHSNNPGAHRPRADSNAHAPQHLPEPTIASWLTNNPAGDEHPGISTIGREYTHAWDQSIMMGMQGDAQTSTSRWRQTYPPDPPYICEPLIASSPLSSTNVLGICERHTWTIIESPISETEESLPEGLKYGADAAAQMFQIISDTTDAWFQSAVEEAS
ncbi:uncharacterized protein F5147DRAFT_659117 [Suillus discolor]|uniref:Uncharacterized protein n=1 Tax=Suillus discolor TaxID=1912936 RepID=A0A9P7ET14_9AGAM|nr:uncharacterized protein F5147DRAFT_659117 [Suillus discolor]KAG2086818.1 hypothetical protein F5147DRAFT_659117 [Suillus discolor]